MSSHLTSDGVQADLYIGHDHAYFPTISIADNSTLKFDSGDTRIGITAPGHLLHVTAPNHDERRDDEMLVSKEAFLEACADSDVKLTRKHRKVIKDMEHDEWRYFLARLLLGGKLIAVLDEFKDEPLLVKNVDA